MKIWFKMNMIISKLFRYLSFSGVLFYLGKPTNAVKNDISGIYFDNIIEWLEVLRVQNYPAMSNAFIISACSLHSPSRYASQSSSSAVGCGAGSGGMTSDILANAPPVPASASPDSPPAGPLPDMPAERTQHIYLLPAGSTTCISILKSPLSIKRILTFPPHGEFIEEIGHKVSTTRCNSHCWETKTNSWWIITQYYFISNSSLCCTSLQQDSISLAGISSSL